ncbi:MAG: 16S rRNA (cytosine(967)-C(5))-methyltransferase RsmB [Pyrinomonadaceae bacterium]|nr:16S rRNA (cytosine(967)-C(5))-methyltransferase RsmB [Pyrinomonadaceae bacterium]
MKISPSRLAAFEILLKIETERAFSSVLLPQYEAKLDERDRGLVHEVVLGTLRRQMYLDRLVDQLSKGKKLDAAVSIALRMGLYQLKFLDRIPDHSAINESVELVKHAKKRSAAGFVNAILRSAVREDVKVRYRDETDRISVETSHPRWLVERWTAQFGLEKAAAIAASNNEIPRVAFRRTKKTSEDVLQVLTDFERSETVRGCYFADRITPWLRELEAAGELYFQDEASQMVAQAVHLAAGDRFLDICASPGSKTTAIAASSDPSAIIIAGDVSGTRTEFLMQNCRRQGCETVQVIQFDAEHALPFGSGQFDVVLVDAPCSGTGTIRHNPEIRYNLDADGFERYSGKQLGLLRTASKVVKNGGLLVYSTCSLEVEENESVCRTFLGYDARFKQIEPNVPLGLCESEGYARTFPHQDGMDGFFIAAFRKMSEA